MPTDCQFKDSLRKDLKMYRTYLKLLQEKKYDELEQEFIDNIERIQAGLED